MSKFAKMEPGELIVERVVGPITREQLIDYAVASGDSNPLHTDTKVAQRLGFEDVIVHGMFGMAILGNLLEEEFPDWEVKKFDSRFLSIMPVNKKLFCSIRLEGMSWRSLHVELTAQVEGSERLAISGKAELTNINKK